MYTALAATVGTGNIVGVATAIKAGGPVSLFWMWLAAFFGMATKYAEGVLAIKYRTKDKNGQISGDPMYYILNGMGEKYKPLAVFFAFSGILVALLGIGTFTQVNAITEAINGSFGIDPKITGIILAILVALVVFGGFLGATVSMAIKNGIARGVFSNESGLGSSPIAAAAKTECPAEQGLISMTGTFIDSLVIWTLTGLSLILSGVWQSDLNEWCHNDSSCICKYLPNNRTFILNS